MKTFLLSGLAIMLCAVLFACPGTSDSERQQQAMTALAQCLSKRGVIMYGSITCSACRSQRKAFGPAFDAITEIECNPHISNTQVERCLKMKIGKTPTWIMEENGKEMKRLEGYQLPEALAAFAECNEYT